MHDNSQEFPDGGLKTLLEKNKSFGFKPLET